jgi:hypothetical protein
MRRASFIYMIIALTLSAVGSAGASAEGSPEAVSVRVQHKLSIRENVHVSFKPGGQLPEGGYYYGVIVLKPYRHYTQKAPPPCSTSSDMERTDYGYPQPGHPVELALTPASSRTGHWCRGGAYIGAIYAVPHAPPCESRYPCRSEPNERSPCWEGTNGRKVCGTVAEPKGYTYPGGLPKPIAKGTLIVGRFSVTFQLRGSGDGKAVAHAGTRNSRRIARY